MKLRGITFVALSVALVLACCSHPEHAASSMPGGTATPDSPSPRPPSLDKNQPANFFGLHNVVAYGPGLLSGSVPEGGDGFETLRALGVKTIVSVDGAVPALEKATACGMRYIHLPIGYSGMDRVRTLELAKAVQVARERNPSAPVYIHCHHGKHRSASASGVVAVILGHLTPEEALSRMRISRTASEYRGLYGCVAEARPATPDDLAAIRSDFPAVWKTSGLVKTMVEVDNQFEHLKAIEHAGWITPEDHPDLIPAAEAERLADLLRGLLGDVRVKTKPAEFRARLVEASKRAGAMADGLLQGRVSRLELSERLGAIAGSCKDCHAKYRDR